MSYLLDTNAFLWHLIEPEKLSDAAIRILDDEASDLWLSMASAWEIAVKHALNRLVLPVGPAEFVASRAQRMGVRILPIELRHIAVLETLPHHHRDPFDRMIVAQASGDGLQLITSDALLATYGVAIVNAGR